MFRLLFMYMFGFQIYAFRVSDEGKARKALCMHEIYIMLFYIITSSGGLSFAEGINISVVSSLIHKL